jgi:hypothetical protein
LGQDNPEQCKWKGQRIKISCFFINRKKNNLYQVFWLLETLTGFRVVYIKKSMNNFI